MTCCPRHRVRNHIAAALGSNTMELPTLDLSHAHAEANPDLQKAFYKQLASALSGSGFVKLHNHGIGPDLIQEAFEWVSAAEEQTPTLEQVSN